MNLSTNVKIKVAHGLMGFVRFLKGYYICLITEKQKIAKVGRHNIYKVKDMKMIPLYTRVQNINREDEDKYVQTFKDVQITEGFYFSYTYDLTHRLQDNILRQIKNQQKSDDLFS